jgi:hypothetical protein
MPRNKIYYPASHIITNLYTSGKEWMYMNYEEYVGFYHTYIDGLVMSGASYSPTDSKDLIPYTEHSSNTSISIYSSLKSSVEYVAPTYSFPKVTLDDYKNGYCTRYFISRRNFNTYRDLIEIDAAQFKLWKRPKTGIDEELYQAIELNWKLTGPINDYVDSNGNIQYGVEDTNKRIVSLKNTELNGLNDYLNDYIELSIYSLNVSDDIKKMFVS